MTMFAILHSLLKHTSHFLKVDVVHVIIYKKKIYLQEAVLFSDVRVSSGARQIWVHTLT